MNDRWLRWQRVDVTIEQQQATEEGRDLSAVEAELAALSAEGAEDADDFQQRVDNLLDRIQSLPMLAGYAYDEPDDLEAIRAARPDDEFQSASLPGESVLAGKIHGAWLGRCVGCLLGKPLEGVRTPELHGLVTSAGKETITDYLWRMGPSAEACQKAGRMQNIEYWKNIDHMPIDDDTNYTLIGMTLVRDRGIDFSPQDVASHWMGNVPVLACCTAERVAYRNFVDQIGPPASATRRNPYREWIGAQIRADFFGYVAAGNPELAAELAWRDACISHVRNGIYGEMWVAAMLAAAAWEDDPRRVVQRALGEVPARSRFSEAIRDVLAWAEQGLSYDAAIGRIHKRWDEYDQHHWCHTISNAQIVAVALLWSEGDFERAITRSVWPGFDTDCNGATVGSVMGMILGADALPEQWTSVLHDTVHSAVAGYHVASISATAGDMARMWSDARKG